MNFNKIKHLYYTTGFVFKTESLLFEDEIK